MTVHLLDVCYLQHKAKAYSFEVMASSGEEAVPEDTAAVMDFRSQGVLTFKLVVVMTIASTSASSPVLTVWPIISDELDLPIQWRRERASLFEADYPFRCYGMHKKVGLGGNRVSPISLN